MAGYGSASSPSSGSAVGGEGSDSRPSSRWASYLSYVARAISGGGTNADGVTSDPAVAGSVTDAHPVASFRVSVQRCCENP